MPPLFLAGSASPSSVRGYVAVCSVSHSHTKTQESLPARRFFISTLLFQRNFGADGTAKHQAPAKAMANHVMLVRLEAQGAIDDNMPPDEVKHDIEQQLAAISASKFIELFSIKIQYVK